MRRGIRAPLFLAAILCAGCATPPPNPAPPASSTAPSTKATPAPATLLPPPAATDSHAIRLASAPLTAAQVAEPMAPATLDLTSTPDDIWERMRRGFSIPDMQSPLVVDQQAWYLSHQDYLQRSIDRAGHYLFHVMEELEKRHMPTELALLPFVESAYNPMAYSRARASGMWQFIPSTGKNFNLQQDFWHDERRDVLASTDAALNYLQALYEMHGDWTLALASYNWGEGAVKRAIDRNASQGRPTDYLSLNMPDETRTYYPKLQALKNIINNPHAFGVSLPHIDNQPYFVTVSVPVTMDVSMAARMADMPEDEFKALNPSFNRPVIAGSPQATLLLPADRQSTFEANLHGNQEPLVTWEAYRVRKGEHIPQIAQHFGMTVAALCEANGLTLRDRLRPGAALLVQKRNAATHGTGITTQSLASVQRANLITMAAPPAAPAPVQISPHHIILSSAHGSGYVVRAGDTLTSIATQFGTSVDSLKRNNRLRGNAISVGQKLVVDSGSGASAAAARK